MKLAITKLADAPAGFRVIIHKLIKERLLFLGSYLLPLFHVKTPSFLDAVRTAGVATEFAVCNLFSVRELRVATQTTQLLVALGCRLSQEEDLVFLIISMLNALDDKAF